MAVIVAFCAEDTRTLRMRAWSVRWRWTWAARDVTTTSTVRGATVQLTSTRQAALRLLCEVIGDF